MSDISVLLTIAINSMHQTEGLLVLHTRKRLASQMNSIIDSRCVNSLIHLKSIAYVLIQCKLQLHSTVYDSGTSFKNCCPWSHEVREFQSQKRR